MSPTFEIFSLLSPVGDFYHITFLFGYLRVFFHFPYFCMHVCCLFIANVPGSERLATFTKASFPLITSKLELVLQGEIKQASPVYTKMVISIVLENIIAWKQLSRIKCPAQLFKLATLRLSCYGNLLISFMCESLATFILSHVRPSELQRKVIIRSTGMPNNTYSSEKEKHLEILKIVSRMYTKSTELQVLFLAFIM